MYSLSQLAFLTALASQAAATTIRIDAGQQTLKFTPNSVNASAGDILEFHFHEGNHSVAMGDFNNPCQPVAAPAGFFSGFMAVSSGEGPSVFQVMVNDTNPIFFYCTQNLGEHCPSGMVGAVNPSGSMTLSDYTSRAASVSSAGSPPSVFGGVVAADTSSSAPSSTGAAPSACPTTGSSSSSSGSSSSSSGGGWRARLFRRQSAMPSGCTTTPSTPSPTAKSAANGLQAPLVGLAAVLGFAAFMA